MTKKFASVLVIIVLIIAGLVTYRVVVNKENASENERRAKLLLEKEAISQEEYDIASADHRTTESQIQLIEAQLVKTSIRAPFSGTIGLRNISKGSYITPTTDIAQLVDVSKVKLQFSIPERYATKVKIGTSVKFTVRVPA